MPHLIPTMNPVRNVTTVHGGGGGRGGRTVVIGGRGGRGRRFFPFLPWWGGWPQPYYPQYTYPQVVVRQAGVICYDASTGSLYAPGTRFDGQAAAPLATREQAGRTLSLVSSPMFPQPRWLWQCPG